MRCGPILVNIEMFYLNNIKQLFLFVEQVDQLEVCLPYTNTGGISKFKVDHLYII